MTDFFRGLEFDTVMPIAALAFLGVCAALVAVAFRSSARRQARVREIVGLNGFSPIVPLPLAEHVVPSDLFRHHGRAPSEDYHVRTHLHDAWRVAWGSLEVLLLEATIHRSRASRRGSSPMAQTASVLRLEHGTKSSPPDFLVEERVLLKSQVRGHLQLRGRERIGEHYYVFAAAGIHEALLEPWLNDEVLLILGQQRSWRIAAHSGVLFVTRGLSLVRTVDYENFLVEGERLMLALAQGS